MQYACDLHLHSCLSPCGDEDMTPANLVNMAALLGLDIIALTDHNSVGNCRSAIAAGEQAGLLVLPGMELCTSEEIHTVCLFEEIEAAEAFAAEVYRRLPPVKNRPEIYGRQLLMNASDGILGEEPLLLVTASAVSIEEAGALAARYGGICYPAHIDRHSFSVLSVFGIYPPHFAFPVAEVTRSADQRVMRAAHPGLEGVALIHASDAHYLENMPEREDALLLELPERSAAAVLERLRRGGPAL